MWKGNSEKCMRRKNVFDISILVHCNVLAQDCLSSVRDQMLPLFSGQTSVDQFKQGLLTITSSSPINIWVKKITLYFGQFNSMFMMIFM